jgi:acetylornithine deacetylase/succinyl-diaminopimelate desuccinylase-like protein
MQVYYGVRGVTTMELTTFGPARALHSGHYGNWAPNPVVEMATILSSMRDTEGRIHIKGFLDDVKPLSAAEKAAIAKIPSIDESLREELSLGRSEAENATLAERIAIPALNVRGIAGGAVGERSANAIPTRATASLDFRLVPDQTPARVVALVRDHLTGMGFHVVTDEPGPDVLRRHPKVVMMRAGGDGYPAARTDLSLPIVRKAVEAIADARGGVIEVPTLGGSLPIFLFQKILRAPLIGVPIVNHDNSQHAANENVRIQNLWDGIEVYAAILSEM